MTVIKHYLLSIVLQDCYVHGYVMTDDYRMVDRVMNEMADVAEKTGERFMPMVLCTTLTSVDEVRKLLGELDPEIAEAMRTATSFHRTVVGVPKADPINSILMALH